MIIPTVARCRHVYSVDTGARGYSHVSVERTQLLERTDPSDRSRRFYNTSIMYVPRRNSSKAAAKTEASVLRSGANTKTDASLLDLETYISKRDFGGALTLLSLQQHLAVESVVLPTKSNGADAKDTKPAGLSSAQQTTWWLAYCHFQCGDYHGALGYFGQLLDSFFAPALTNYFDMWRLSRACCLYYLYEFQEAEREALLSTRLPLCNRVLYLLAHHRKNAGGGELVLLDRYKQLQSDSLEDQLSLAFTSYIRRNYQEAIEIYKRLALEHRDMTGALHVYLAMCYFQLDYFDVSLELLAVYLEAHPDSFVASNLKASNQFRLYSGVEANQELETFRKRNPAHPCNQEIDNKLDPTGTRAVLQHNQAIYADDAGSNAALRSILMPLVSRIDEARMNLVISHLHRHEYREAFELIEDLEEPETTVEHIVKAILHAMIGEQTNSKEHIFLAEKYFHAIGSSKDERDTIPGRQCMASYHLLRKEFQEANVYFSSIASYLISSDAFNWNYGLALAAYEQYQEAEEVLLRVKSERLRNELVFCSWLARAYIHNGKNAGLAWELYLRMENTADAFKLLKLIANDYYKVNNFYFAVKAFDVLERLDPDPEYWEAKRGACMGYFQQVALGHESIVAARCDEVLKLLLASKNVVESNRLGTMLKKWAQSFLP